MMRNTYLLGSSLLLLGAGCQKTEIAEPACAGHCTTVTGRFTTDNRTAPIAGLPLRLEWVNRTGVFHAEVRTKARAVTDAQGNYRLSFYLKDDELRDGYFEITYSADASRFIVDRDSKGASWLELTRDTAIISNWLLPRRAFVHPEISNPAQVVGNYWGQYSFANSDYGYQGRFTYGVVFRFGADTMPLADIEVAANQPVDLQTDKVRNGVRIITHDTIRLQPGATYVHRVSY